MKLLQRRETQAPSTKPARGARTVVTESRWKRLIRETRSELKKVIWPTRDQTVKLTTIVIAASIAVGLFLGGVDLFFERLIQLILGGV